MPPRSACAERSRYIPKALVVQRGLNPAERHRESRSPTRFAVSSTSRVCVPPDETHKGRTACYAEHSARRKYCPLLSSDGRMRDLSHPPGLFLSGIGPYEDDEDDKFETLILGPYPTEPTKVVMKRIPFAQVFETHEYPENIAIRFTSWRDSVIPSFGMLKTFCDDLPPMPVNSVPHVCKSNANKCLSHLLERREMLMDLKRRCATSPDLMKVCRRVLRNVFYFAMYARRWAGPGTPYPIARSETNRNVGSHKAISPELKGMLVSVSSSGDVLLKESSGREGSGGEDAADYVSNGKAMAMMNAHLFATFASVDSLPDPAVRDFLISHILIAIPQPTTDGTHWPAEERLWDTLFGGECSVATQGQQTCIRQISSTLLHTCTMLYPLFYKTQPQWMRYEGVVDNVQ